MKEGPIETFKEVPCVVCPEFGRGHRLFFVPNPAAFRELGLFESPPLDICPLCVRTFDVVSPPMAKQIRKNQAEAYRKHVADCIAAGIFKPRRIKK